jgi:hypothetical protein
MVENPASKIRSLDIAFLVDADQLQRLVAILSEAGSALEYTVKFSDGTSVNYTAIGEILTQPNSKRHSIVSILAGAVGTEGRSAYITLGDNPTPSVEYTIAGPQRDVIYLAEKLDDWAAGIHQWYSPLVSNLQLISAAFVVALPLVVAFGLKFFFPASGPGLQSSIPGCGLILTALAEFWAFKAFFPRGTFAIGYGLKRAQRLEIIEISVVLAFAVEFFAGLFAHWALLHL